jgi:hypothetical protein
MWNNRSLRIGNWHLFSERVHVRDEELFSFDLEEINSNVEVINAGVGGYGMVQEYLYLTGEGLAFRPDIVLLLFYENDLSDNCLSYYPAFGPRPYAVWIREAYFNKDFH